MAESLGLVPGKPNMWELLICLGRDSDGRVRYCHARLRSSCKVRRTLRLTVRCRIIPASISVFDHSGKERIRFPVPSPPPTWLTHKQVLAR